MSDFFPNHPSASGIETAGQDAKPAMAADVSFLRWTAVGAGLPLVLLHGIGSQARSWAPLVAALGGQVPDVVAWDAPGYGDSLPLGARRPNPNDYADALAEMLKALGIVRMILVGHSLGCLFAARYALKRPGQVAALALLSPALGYCVAPDAAMPPNVQARIDDLDRMGPNCFAATRAARLVYDPDANPALVERVRLGMAAVRQPGYGQAAHALAAGDLPADAGAIVVPTLVAVGAEDRVTPPAGARRVHALLRHSAGYAEAENVGHAFPQQAPQYVAGLLASLSRGVVHA